MLREMWLSIGILFISIGVVANAQNEAEEGERSISESELPVVYYDVHRNLTLNCTDLAGDASAPFLWMKNNKSVEEVPELKERLKLEEGGGVLSVKGKATEEDYGQYRCQRAGAERVWDVRGRPVARLPDNTNVVEGLKLKIQCKVIGKPYPRVEWWYRASEGANASRVSAGEGEGEGGGVSLEASEAGVPEGALVVAAAEHAHAGIYECRPPHGPPDHTTLRVKDKYAALWPFLGICAEVFVLCAIILVYEKRRTKPELDDSDTDNHDQKKS